MDWGSLTAAAVLKELAAGVRAWLSKKRRGTQQRPPLGLYVVNARIHRLSTPPSRLYVFQIMIANKADVPAAIKEARLSIVYRRQNDQPFSNVVIPHSAELATHLPRAAAGVLSLPTSLAAYSAVAGLALFQVAAGILQGFTGRRTRYRRRGYLRPRSVRRCDSASRGTVVSLKRAAIELAHAGERNAVPIAWDAMVASQGVAEGKMIPLLILDTSSRPDIDDMIAAHKYLGAGDVRSYWGRKSRFDKSRVQLVLAFDKPSHCVIVLEFEALARGGAVDAIVSAQGLYIQGGRPGDRAATTLDRPLESSWRSRPRSSVPCGTRSGERHS